MCAEALATSAKMEAAVFIVSSGIVIEVVFCWDIA
jgi:hypothetical protein